jgi:lantibiotic modifying enzyme
MDKKEISKILRQFGETLEMQWRDERNVGILAGKSGIALFLYDLSAFLNDSHYAEIGDAILYDCFDNMNEGYNLTTYCSGIAGLGWALEHLQNRDILSIDDEDMLDKIDDVLFDRMKIDFSNKNCDFLHGAVGYGFYFFKRWKHAKNPTAKKQFATYIEYSVLQLEQLSDKDPRGLTWMTTASVSSDNEPTYNLSLSHGMSSIISYLQRVAFIPEFTERCSRLIVGSVDFIRSFRSEGSRWHYPYFVKEDKRTYDPNTGRLAWCYGDLGLGFALYGAAAKVNANLIDSSLETLSRCALMTDPKIAGVSDAGLCHGAFGVAHIFQKLAGDTHEDRFRDAAQFWLNEGLAMKKDDKVSGGYQHLLTTGWINSYSILNGISGIGLSLLSLMGMNNNWDECLLLDFPAPV